MLCLVGLVEAWTGDVVVERLPIGAFVDAGSTLDALEVALCLFFKVVLLFARCCVGCSCNRSLTSWALVGFLVRAGAAGGVSGLLASTCSCGQVSCSRASRIGVVNP